MEHFTQTNVFAWISTVFAHLIIGCAIRYPKIGNLRYLKFLKTIKLRIGVAVKYMYIQEHIILEYRGLIQCRYYANF